MKKFLLYGTIFVLIVAAVAVFLVFNYRNLIVQHATVVALEYVLEVDVELGGANLDVANSRVEFTDLVIHNPDGYKSEFAMKFGKVAAQVDIQSFQTQEPIIKRIDLIDSHIVAELKRGGSNLQDLINSSMRFSGDTPVEPVPEDKQVFYKIDLVHMESNTARVAIPFAGGKTVNVNLPDMQLKNLGGRDQGVQAGKAVAEFITALLVEIRKNGVNLPAEALANLTNTIKDLPNELKNSIARYGTDIQNLVGDMGKQLENAGQSIKDATGKGLEETGKAIKNAGETLKESGSQALDKGKEALKEGGDKIKEGIGGLKDAAGGLFGGKKDKEDK